MESHMSSYRIKGEKGRMTSKGQVLIPRAVSDAIGLAPNAPYKVMINDQNQAVVAPVGHGPEDAEEGVRRMREGLRALRGVSKLGMSTDEYVKLIRGDFEP
jgi:antitoxin PrlF